MKQQSFLALVPFLRRAPSPPVKLPFPLLLARNAVSQCKWLFGAAIYLRNCRKDQDNIRIGVEQFSAPLPRLSSSPKTLTSSLREIIMSIPGLRLEIEVTDHEPHSPLQPASETSMHKCKIHKCRVGRRLSAVCSVQVFLM